MIREASWTAVALYRFSLRTAYVRGHVSDLCGITTKRQRTTAVQDAPRVGLAIL